MDPALAKNLDETIKELEKEAEALYQKGDDAAAASAYEKLAQLYQRFANAAPPGPIEAVRKNKAIACRAKANTLRAGAAPRLDTPARTGGTPASGGRAEEAIARRPSASGAPARRSSPRRRRTRSGARAASSRSSSTSRSHPSCRSTLASRRRS
jgi:hypothetical protein